MNLENFVQNTLLDISKGIKSANKEDHGKFTIGVYGSMSKEHYISFDVAVTVNKENSKSGGGGVQVAFANIGGKTGKSATEEHVSRVKFQVYVQRIS